MGMVIMRGNFEEKEVMNWFEEEMGKEAEVFRKETNVCQMHCRSYGEIQELEVALIFNTVTFKFYN